MTSTIEQGVRYECEGVCFAKVFWFDGNGFHHKTDKSDPIYGGMSPSMIPDYALVCNSETEKYIKANCTPPFVDIKESIVVK